MSRILIIPGYNGSQNGHWQRHWLEDDPFAQLVEQESWTHPVLDIWMRALEYELMASPGAILVAHSLGATLVANLAGRLSAGHVAGAVLVAPADVESAQRRHPGRIEFGGMPRRRLPFPSVVVASRNDPYMLWPKTRDLVAIWGSGIVDLGNAGHINVASGFGRWTEGYALASGLDRNGRVFQNWIGAPDPDKEDSQAA
jgi:uncharacterized protein